MRATGLLVRRAERDISNLAVTIVMPQPIEWSNARISARF